jgi:hypothetical protein
MTPAWAKGNYLMRYVTSLAYDSRQKIVVLVENDGGPLIAYGVDAQLPPMEGQFAFVRRVTNLGGFLKALVDGDVPGPEANSVEIPSTPPPSPWPRLQAVISYAQRLHADEALAVHAA